MDNISNNNGSKDIVSPSYQHSYNSVRNYKEQRKKNNDESKDESLLSKLSSGTVMGLLGKAKKGLAPVLKDIEDSRNTNGILQTLQQTRHELMKLNSGKSIGAFSDNNGYFDTYYNYLQRQSDMYRPTPYENVTHAQMIHRAHQNFHKNVKGGYHY